MAHVILIEPDKLLAINVATALKRRGHSVDWQVEPQAATDSADKRHPDIVILDLLLAGRSGVEFLYELRSYPEWLELPVVIFSDVSPAELGASVGGFDQLNISAFHHKAVTSLAQLTDTVELLLQTAKT